MARAAPRPRLTTHAAVLLIPLIDDADRDRASVTPGPLLDTALIGAIRKGMVAMAAADETAIALARGLADHPLASRLDRLRDAALAGDKALHVLLDRSARGAQ